MAKPKPGARVEAEADAWLENQAERLSPEDYYDVFAAWLSHPRPYQPPEGV